MPRKKKFKDTQEYRWDFSEVFSDQKDFEKSVRKVKTLLKKVVSYKGVLHKATREEYLKFYDTNATIRKEFDKLILYSYWYTSDMNNKVLLQNYSTFQVLTQEITVATSFVPGEIRKLGEKTILSYIESSKKHKYLYDSVKEYFRVDKLHLSDAQEETLSHFSQTLGAASETYSMLTDADKKYHEIEYKGKKNQKLTQTLLSEILLQTDPKDDQELRLKAANLDRSLFHDKANTFASIYGTVISQEMIKAKLKGFNSALHYATYRDNAPEKSLTLFTKFAYDNANVLYEYKKFHRTEMKKKGIKKYYNSDSQLILLKPKKSDMEFTVDDSIKIIKEATAFLGDEYKEAIDDGLKYGRVDYYQREGKYSGGFMISRPSLPAYILMNWSNEISSLIILAHEAGHAAHSYLSSKSQPYEYANYPIIVAEIASSFLEMLVLDLIIQRAERKEMKAYALQWIINRLSTCYFFVAREASFELKAKQLAFDNKPLNKDVFAEIDNELKIGEGAFDKPPKTYPAVSSNYTWSRIPHHFGTTFYVHKYALTYTVSVNLFKQYKETGEVKGFTDLLKLGGRYAPLDMIKDTTGVDLTTTKPHKEFIEYFKHVLNELQKIATR